MMKILIDNGHGENTPGKRSPDGRLREYAYAREARQLTQAELGERMGVKRSQVCRLESGKSITLSSMMRAFNALGVQVALDMKGVGSVVL